MPELSADTIREGSQALVRISNPNVFATVMALLATAAVGAMLYWNRQDQLEERHVRKAQIAALESMSEHVAQVHEDLLQLGLHRRHAPIKAAEREAE